MCESNFSLKISSESESESESGESESSCVSILSFVLRVGGRGEPAPR